MSASPPPKGPLARVDHAVYRAERALAGVLFLLMALVMFVSVIHDIFDRAEGRLPLLAMDVFRALGGSVDAARTAWFHGPFSAGLNLALMFLLAYGIARTVKLAKPLSRWQALGAGAAGAALLWGGVRFILWYWPNGLVWAPKISLACMLWVGFLGSSLATYERRHLGIELAEKIWPKAVARHVKALALAAAVALCLFLLYLSWISLLAHHASWKVNHLTNIIDETVQVPRWLVLTVVTYTFVVMSLRLSAQAVRAITHPEEGGGGEILPGLPGAEDEAP